MSLRLVDTLTYWTEAGRTGGGGIVWVAGVTVPSRNADVQREINKPDGQFELSKKVFYSEAIIPVGSRVAEGDYSGNAAPPDTGAFRIAEIKAVGSMNAVRAAWGV